MDFSLLEFVPDGIVVVDDHGAVAYVNAMAERLFGWPRAELLGKPVEILLPERMRAAHVGVREGYRAAPRPRPMGMGNDLAARRKDGSEFPAEISLSPLRAGEATWAVAAVRDTTERRRMEAKALLYRQAQEEVRARDEFLSVASHELRTPMTALHVQVQMLERVVERSGSPAAVRERVGSLDRQVRRIAGLVEALLDLSRIRLGRMELRREAVDLAALTREVAAPYQADLDLARGSSVRVLAPAPVPASIDRVRIEQVLGNLLGNAVKFGEGKPIEIRIAGGGGTARVEVADSGVGIDAAETERIFGRFERAAPAQHYPGLGLGLYVAREIVEAHGGRIHARGEPGKGAVFTVELPA
ncbi:MAG TPA: PAS domain-containing sensor histidine kinase [Anaeromyxobacteraceae bacterium]|nr:PAS domain-containing sensor histidine kinase [Anaeromyxobacteraceae bacterium]